MPKCIICLIDRTTQIVYNYQTFIKKNKSRSFLLNALIKIICYVLGNKTIVGKYVTNWTKIRKNALGVSKNTPKYVKNKPFSANFNVFLPCSNLLWTYFPTENKTEYIGISKTMFQTNYKRHLMMIKSGKVRQIGHLVTYLYFQILN